MKSQYVMYWLFLLLLRRTDRIVSVFNCVQWCSIVQLNTKLNTLKKWGLLLIFVDFQKKKCGKGMQGKDKI